MHLKQVELLGFKSFPHKTLIRFSDGVTAIVGPNGCGKTNVLDALRWVLGEQKPTLMRGGKMEEVVFNGTREMKALGMAEVTLRVINDRGVLPTEYHEVQITRRLFRSGESEYLLNKVPCRLKDITDLFADTGVGAHSYSVIQQFMIDAVISDKAEERRFLFEEAAGITKYKQRRKAALRKLESTENDFLRLKDIYSEVKTRVNSLYRQHKKAERYQELSDQIKAWEVFLGATRMRALESERRQLQAGRDELADRGQGCQAVLDLAAGELEGDRRELLDLEHRLGETGSEIYEISEEAHRLEKEISILREKSAAATRLIEKNRSEIAALQQRESALQIQLSESDAGLESEKTQLAALETELAAAQEAHAEADRRLFAARVAREAGNKRLVELEGRLSSGQTEVNGLREMTTELERQLEELENQVVEKTPRQSELIKEIEQRRLHLEEAAGRKGELDRQRRGRAEEIEQKLELGEGLVAEAAELTASREAGRARLQLLQEMILQHEGFDSGVVAAMKARDGWPDLMGTVADLFVPVAGMERLLEASLGEMARFLVCRTRPTAEQIIVYLKEGHHGRVGILVPHSGTLTAAIKRPEIDFPGVIGWLDNYVSADESLRPLKEAVLSTTLVVDRASADIDAILERLPYGFGAVSTDSILYRKNLIAGGSAQEVSLFRRRERLAEQEAAIVEIEARLADNEAARNRNTIEIARLRAESAQLASELDALVEQIESDQGQLNEVEYERRTLATEFARWEREKQALAARLENARARQYHLGLDSSGIAEQKTHLLTTIEQSGNELQKAEAGAGEAGSRVSGLQIATIEARSRVQQIEAGRRHTEELLSGLSQTRSRLSAEIDQATRDIEHAAVRLQALEAELKGCFETRARKTESQRRLRETQAGLLARVTDKETRVKRLRQDKDSVSGRLHDTELRLTAVSTEASGLVSKMFEEYEVDISAVEIARPDENVGDEEAPQLLSQMRETLRNFGAVNLLALEEYDAANEREKFLGEQLADLTKAKTDLKTTITRINQTARQLFDDTFSKVQENFRNLFVELFPGGEASIRLIYPDDPLESDIEIIARPGGKKLLPITVLSGGERALTAIALLFSLYLVKPSPFCILDEIDAPLDDANCKRFLRIIRSFSRQTQFIVITHNKITMEAADNLYGITMEEPGVSKLVAVKFKSNGDGSGDEAATLETVGADGTDSLPEAIRDRIEPGISVNRDSSS